MTLQEKLDAFRLDFESGNPPYNAPKAVVEIMRRATDELIASGAAKNALKTGDTAPEFALSDQDGNVLTSAELLARGPLIVSFYRGVWCPYCNMELKALEEALLRFEAAGAALVAISPQNQTNSRKSVRDNGVTFPILSDPGNETAAAFGIRFKLPDYLADLYGRFGNDLPAINGDASWTLPMPARFVIGTDRIIRYAEVNPDYTRRPEPLDLLPALRDEAIAAE
ncbi:MAG TPA: peroxiredoxin-like family protein [Sphingomicrobium sp.]|nr:peroxiredoxin-like family protein [Sphingomicrobium sp.]